MKQLLVFLMALAVSPAAFAQLPPAPEGDPAHPDTVIEFGEAEDVIVETEEGEIVFSTLIADSDPERTRGLMFREVLGDDEGMLFDYETPQPASIWMRNTLISLDIVFIDESGVIVKIIGNAQPRSLRQLPSDFPVLGVLELRGGLTRERGIRPGDMVRHRIFDNLVLEEPAEDALEMEDAAPEEDTPAESEEN